MIKAGSDFAKTLTAPAVLELIGDVGAGKTTFTRGIAQGLGVKEGVTSPSFTLSKEYAGKGISIADLIAEGNLALIESINSYKQAVDLTTFKNQLTRDITNAMTKLILEQDGSSKIGNHVADRANLLDRASRELSEKLGKTPTLQELAEYVSLPEDEVQRIMQISLDAMNASLNPDQ